MARLCCSLNNRTWHCNASMDPYHAMQHAIWGGGVYTPDAAAAWGAEIAEEVHEENLESRLKVERAFEDAEAEQNGGSIKQAARARVGAAIGSPNF